MSGLELIKNYSYAIDVASVVFCIIIFIIIRNVLYFSTDRKFTLLKRSTLFIFVGAIANVLFAIVCENSPDSTALIYLCRAINHSSFFGCLYLFILYLKQMLDVKGQLATVVSYVTRFIFVSCFVLDMCSGKTGLGLYKGPDGWRDPIISFYNAFYLYGVILLFVMLLFYNHRLIKSVRTCLICTELLVLVIMINSAINNTNTFTSLTYVLPIVVVMIILHSNPIDDKTGTMSSISFQNFVQKYVEKKISMDFMVLQLIQNIDENIPMELGKILGTFWHRYFVDASSFMVENGVYILAIPRTKKNINTDSIIKELIYDVLPQYYVQFNVLYKVIGLLDFDFIHNSQEIKEIINYLLLQMEANDVLIVDEELKNQLRIMRSVIEQLTDIAKNNDLNDERVLVYCQPIKNAKSGIYDTAEALMRLSIPEQEVVSPVLFIPLAESYGYIHSLTKIMLNKVCKQLKSLEDEGFEYKRVSINIAVSELRNADFYTEIMDIINSNGINPSKIGIELTESQNENDFRIVRDKIRTLKESGITIYLDDFGTGYSNFNRIMKLGVDVIKLDRSFLITAENDAKMLYILQQLANTFKQLDYQLLFEGVESQKHEQICCDYGADYLQGFKYSKPIPIEQLRNYFVRK